MVWDVVEFPGTSKEPPSLAVVPNSWVTADVRIIVKVQIGHCMIQIDTNMLPFLHELKSHEFTLFKKNCYPIILSFNVYLKISDAYTRG